MIFILQTLSTAYILFYVVLLVIGFVRPFRLSRLWYVLNVLLALSMAFWGYCLIADSSLDLYRLESYIDTIRNASTIAALGDTVSFGNDFEGLIGFNALCYLIALLPDSGSWLAFFAALITMSLILPVLTSYVRSEGLNSRVLLPALIVIFMGMQLHYIFSGVRNSMAVAFAVAGLYLFFYKKKHKILALILLILSPTIHPSTLIILPAILICGIKGQLIWRACGLLAMPIAFLLAEYLQYSPITFINYVSNRILFYTDTAYKYDRPEMIANMLVFIGVGSTYWLLRHNGFINISENEKRYANAYYFLGFVMLGCVVHRDFALRMGYLMGIGSVPLLCKIFFHPWQKTAPKTAVVLLLLLTYCILVCCYKVYYDTFYVISQWNFL